jgi:hypothetical protein
MGRIIATATISCLANAASAWAQQVETLVCEPDPTVTCQPVSCAGGHQVYDVDLAARTISSRPGSLDGLGSDAVPADISETNITWRWHDQLMRIDRTTGVLQWNNPGAGFGPGWHNSALICHAAKKIL